MSVKIYDINIACDAALDQDINQEIGFLGEQERISFIEYEEQRDTLEREFYDIYDSCNGTGYLDNKENKPHCPNCKDTKLVESSIPMVGEEECYYCKDLNE